MIKYRVDSGSTMAELVSAVYFSVECGWTPIGGVSACSIDGVRVFFQAMTKPEDSEERIQKLNTFLKNEAEAIQRRRDGSGGGCE